LQALFCMNNNDIQAPLRVGAKSLRVWVSLRKTFQDRGVGEPVRWAALPT